MFQMGEMYLLRSPAVSGLENMLCEQVALLEASKQKMRSPSLAS